MQVYNVSKTDAARNRYWLTDIERTKYGIESTWMLGKQAALAVVGDDALTAIFAAITREDISMTARGLIPNFTYHAHAKH